MNEVAIRYSDVKLTNLTFDEFAQNQMKFKTVKCTDLIVNTTEETGTLLNGRKYNHLLYKHNEIEIIISADEIDRTILRTFLQVFWAAKFKYLSLYDIVAAEWSNYIQVATEGGRFPLSYIDDVRELREVQFMFTSMEPI